MDEFSWFGTCKGNQAINEQLVIDMVKAYCRREEALSPEGVKALLPERYLGGQCCCDECARADVAIAEFEKALEAVVTDVYPWWFLLNGGQDG